MIKNPCLYHQLTSQRNQQFSLNNTHRSNNSYHHDQNKYLPKTKKHLLQQNQYFANQSNDYNDYPGYDNNGKKSKKGTNFKRVYQNENNFTNRKEKQNNRLRNSKCQPNFETIRQRQKDNSVKSTRSHQNNYRNMKDQISRPFLPIDKLIHNQLQQDDTNSENEVKFNLLQKQLTSCISQIKQLTSQLESVQTQTRKNHYEFVLLRDIVEKLKIQNLELMSKHEVFLKDKVNYLRLNDFLEQHFAQNTNAQSQIRYNISCYDDQLTDEYETNIQPEINFQYTFPASVQRNDGYKTFRNPVPSPQRPFKHSFHQNKNRNQRSKQSIAKTESNDNFIPIVNKVEQNNFTPVIYKVRSSKDIIKAHQNDNLKKQQKKSQKQKPHFNQIKQKKEVSPSWNDIQEKHLMKHNSEKIQQKVKENSKPHFNQVFDEQKAYKPDFTQVKPRGNILKPTFNNFSPKQSILEPKQSNISPKQSRISPKSSHLEPYQSNFKVKENSFEPKQNRFKQFEDCFEEKQSKFQPAESKFQIKQSQFESKTQQRQDLLISNPSIQAPVQIHFGQVKTRKKQSPKKQQTQNSAKYSVPQFKHRKNQKSTLSVQKVDSRTDQKKDEGMMTQTLSRRKHETSISQNVSSSNRKSQKKKVIPFENLLKQEKMEKQSIKKKQQKIEQLFETQQNIRQIEKEEIVQKQEENLLESAQFVMKKPSPKKKFLKVSETSQSEFSLNKKPTQKEISAPQNQQKISDSDSFKKSFFKPQGPIKKGAQDVNSQYKQLLGVLDELKNKEKMYESDEQKKQELKEKKLRVEKLLDSLQKTYNLSV